MYANGYYQNVNLAEKSLICFDLGGILVKMAASWNESLTLAGLSEYCRDDLNVPVHTFEPYNLHEVGRMSDADYLASLAAYLGLPSSQDAYQAHLGFLYDPYPGTLELVNDIHKAGLHTACLSNTEEWHWQKMISALYPAVQAIQEQMASHILNARKPDTEIFLAASRRVSVEPNQVVYFDDVLSNVEGAQKAGWDAYLIDKTGDTAAQMRSILGL